MKTCWDMCQKSDKRLLDSNPIKKNNPKGKDQDESKSNKKSKSKKGPLKAHFRI